jgi:glyoxylase-like metal-dependent hydrolase (beta-lactamase superfamily II)
MQTSNAGIHHIKVGDIGVTALNDGAFQASTDFLVGPTKAESEALLAGTFRRNPPWITISCFLLSIGERRVLVDIGSGTAFGPDHGKARQHLTTLGVQPEEIDTVLVTHAHIDHISGLIDPAGAAWFPKAELVLHEAEPAFWLSAENAAKAPESARSGFATAAAGLTPYAARTRTVTNGGEALPGITSVHLPGHTPGHTGWLIASGNDSLLIWGDVVHLPGIQFARPDAGMGFDVDVELGRASRARAFDMAATDRLRVAGMHLDFPLFGHVARAGTGYAFVPEVWFA